MFAIYHLSAVNWQLSSYLFYSAVPFRVLPYSYFACEKSRFQIARPLLWAGEILHVKFISTDFSVTRLLSMSFSVALQQTEICPNELQTFWSSHVQLWSQSQMKSGQCHSIMIGLFMLHTMPFSGKYTFVFFNNNMIWSCWYAQFIMSWIDKKSSMYV